MTKVPLKHLLAELSRNLEINQERAELLREIDEAILRSTFSAQEVLNLIVQKCLSKTGATHGQVVQYHRDRLTVVASTDPSSVGVHLPLESLCGKAILERESQSFSDLAETPMDRYVRSDNETRSELALLIKPEHSARILGVLELEREGAGPFDRDAVAFAELLASEAAIAMAHARTWSAVRMLYDVSTSLLSGKVSIEEGFQTILDAVLEQLDFENGQILALTGNEFVILASSRKEDIGLRLHKDNSICGRFLIAEQM